MHRGYIKLWRKTLDSGLIQLPNALTLFIYMLMEATHKPIRKGTVSLERGQLVTGRHQLAAELAISEQSVRTALAHLINLDFITSESTNKYTVYSIVNYNKYQDIDTVCNQQINQQATNEQPTSNQQATTIQEHKHIETIDSSISTASDAADDVSVKYTKAFLTFWDMYPNKKNKGAAFKAFKKVKPAEYPAVKEGLLAKQKSVDWLKDNGQFIPHPATWLNARGWEDETADPDSKPTDINEFYKKIGAIQ